MRQFAVVLAFAFCVFPAPARTQALPSVTIADAAWLTGRWVGEGFGGELEETWAPPAGGQMIGHFRMVRDGRPVFYEFVLIEEHEGGLRYRVKHFNPDMVGWEERDAFHEFAWLGSNGEDLHFDGLILRRIGEDLSDHIITTRSADGITTEQTLRYRRAAD
jgi:hypothetical protein